MKEDDKKRISALLDVFDAYCIENKILASDALGMCATFMIQYIVSIAPALQMVEEVFESQKIAAMDLWNKQKEMRAVDDRN